MTESSSSNDSAPLFASHDLPARWQGKRVFTLFDTTFDGARLLGIRKRWREDDARCERLHVIALGTVSVLDAPPVHDDELARVWPMRVEGLHRLEFDAGRVVLTLAIGDAHDMLSRVWARVDAFHLDAIARIANDDATVSADASCNAQRAALKASGFEFDDNDNGMPVARFAPRWRVRRHEPPLACEAARDVSTRQAIVIGAGLAGCAVTSRLTSRGWDVTLIDRHAWPARDASGNPAGVFHPVVWRDESAAARLTRAGFLYALNQWQALESAGHELHRSRAGLLQIADTSEEADAIASAIECFGFPRDYVTSASPDEASRLAGVRVTRGGWFFPHGGSISPAELCAAQLREAADRVRMSMNTEAARIAYDGTRWQVFDSNGEAIAAAPVLVLANAHDAVRLANLYGEPTRSVRGQLSLLDAAAPLDALRLPVVGEGYAVPLSQHETPIGATYDIDSPDRDIRETGHIENVERVAGMQAVAHGGRVAFRCVTSDRMPMIGQLAGETLARRDARQLSSAWPLDLPRMPGLFGAFAFGSRGLTWAALAAELIASQIEGEPWPIPRDLADAIDPARFLLRTLRRGDITLD